MNLTELHGDIDFMDSFQEKGNGFQAIDRPFEVDWKSPKAIGIVEIDGGECHTLPISQLRFASTGDLWIACWLYAKHW